MIDKVKLFKNDTFPLVVGICDNANAYEKLMKKFRVDIDGEYCQCAGEMASFDTNMGLVCIVSLSEHLDYGNVSGVMSILCHEITHVGQRIFEYIGESSPCKESVAYVNQWVMGKLYKELERCRRLGTIGS